MTDRPLQVDPSPRHLWSEADPLEIVPFRRRLIRTVVFLVVILTVTATGLSVRLSETMSREREALMLAAQLDEDERVGQTIRMDDLSRRAAMSARTFERVDEDGTLWRWGFSEDRATGAWAAVQRPGAAPVMLTAASPPDTPEMVETVVVRLVFGAGVLSWLTFWAGLLVTQGATRRLQASSGQLVHAWTHDRQTGLLARDRFLELVDAAEPDDGGALLTIPLLDYNEQQDTLGPKHADAALQELVARFREAVPDGVRIGRTATDCLTAWLPGEQRDQAATIAAVVYDRLDQPLVVDGFTVLPSVSVGVALRPDDGTEANVLLARAGRASRSEEALSRGVALYHASMEADQVRNLWMRPLLRTAIDTGSITLAYQPKVDANTGRIVGAEALARWTDAERGVIFPDQFISVAEQSGQIHALTRHLLHLAAKQSSKLWQLGYRCPIAVNLSAICMGEPELEEMLVQLMQDYGLTPDDLEIEITETATLARPAQTLAQLRRIREQGFRVAIDDFGTGQSSLAQLASLPVDDVKIDQAFIRPLDPDAPESDPAWRLVGSIIRLAGSLNRTTTAEGVENVAVGARLASLGCTTLQGWAYSKAVAPDAFEQLLEDETTYPVTRAG